MVLMVSTNGAKPQHHAKNGYDIFFKAQKNTLPKDGVINYTSYITGTRSHGGDEGNATARRCRRHKERRRYIVQILDNYFEVNALYINY